MPEQRVRRIGGWGFEGERFEPAAAMLAWLGERLGGAGEPVPAFDPASAARLAAPLALPALPGASTAPLDRLAHARGQGISDLVRLRTGTVRRAPDAVVRPASPDDVRVVLERAGRDGCRVVVWGGGSSVTGGLNLDPDSPPTVALDLERSSGLVDLDRDSGLATFGAGTYGPALEAALAAGGLTLGHFPQSFERSTLGGWIATRASGQESLGFGRIEDLVAGAELIAPAGDVAVRPRPAAAVGPEPLELVLGSEGRMGVLWSATVRVRPAPARRSVRAYLVPDWTAGVAAARALVQGGVPLALLRLSDEPETAVAMRVGLAGHGRRAALLGAYLRLRGRRDFGCLLFLGAAGSAADLRRARDAAGPFLAAHGALALGASPGRQWLADRFRHPYLRDGLLDRGIGTDTFETSAPWSRLAAVYAAVRAATPLPILCHLSHPYRDGASLYFTFFFKTGRGADATIGRWADAKRRVTDALLAAGATLSHHHGVGSWHAPWYRRAVGEAAAAAFAAAARSLDPQGVLNPAALFDPRDRLEV